MEPPFGSVWVAQRGLWAVIAVGGTGDSWGSGCGPCIRLPLGGTPGSGSPSLSRQPHPPPELLTERLPDLCQDVRFEGVRQAVTTGHDLDQVLGKPVLFWYSSWVWESVLLVSRCVRVMLRLLVLRSPYTPVL